MRRATVPFLVVLVLAGTLIAAYSPGQTDAHAAASSRIVRPGIYTFYDWQHFDSAAYPVVGGHVTVQWKTLDAVAGSYNWAWLDEFLARDAALGKVDGVGLDPYDGPCCGGSGVPEYVKAQRPDVEITCRTEALPAYWRPSFKDAYGRFIADFGRRFNGDPRIAFLQIGVGMFGETQPGRDEHDACLEAAGLSSAAWLDYAKWAIDAYAAAFPDTPLILEYAPRYLYVCERRELADYAAARGVGLQHSGLIPDGGGATVLNDPASSVTGCGQYDPMLAWSGRVPLGWEGTEWGEHTGPAATLWRIYNALDKHPDFILLDASQVSDPARWGMLEFANRYVARTVRDAPAVWAALRETDYDWFPQRGNYEYWLYQVHGAPGGRTVPLWRVGDAAEGRFTRRTDQAMGNRYMVFDVDDRYLYDVQQLPVTVTVTYLDQGLDGWSLDYDARGPAVATSDVVTKTNTGQWLTSSFILRDASFAGRLPGAPGRSGADLRIDSRGDGDETVHLVVVEGMERPPAALATAIPASATGTPTPTPTPTSTAVVPAVTATPTSPYMSTPEPQDPRLTPTPATTPLPPPNGASAYGSIE